MELTVRDALANQTTYRDDAIVRRYARTADLKAPERTVLDIIAPRLAGMRMLDIGVGGGRTTLYFADRVREYVAIDYSEEMVAACRARFAGRPGLRFVVGDARRMAFADHEFDFVLFSFNGIDGVGHADRLAILGEIARVGRPGGLFAFSTHNLRHFATIRIPGLLRDGIRAMPGRLRQAVRLRFRLNPIGTFLQAQQAPHVIINDGLHGGRVLQYYVRPSEQAAQLAQLFDDIHVFSGRTGAKLSERELRATDDPWLYYLCTIR